MGKQKTNGRRADDTKVGPKLIKAHPPGSSSEYIACRTASGSAKCSKESKETMTSTGLSTRLTNSHRPAIPAFSACSRATRNHFSEMSSPITRLAPSSAISFASAPGPHPKSRTTLSLISASMPGKRTRSLLFPVYAPPSIVEGNRVAIRRRRLYSNEVSICQ